MGRFRYSKPDQLPRTRLFMPARDTGYAGFLHSGVGMQNLSLTSAELPRATLLIKTALEPRYLTTISMPGGLAILATVSGGIVGSVYAPPKATAPELAAFIMRLRNYNRAMVLAGDWSSRSTNWSAKSCRAQAHGNCLSAARRCCTHAPVESSVTGARGTSTVDFVVTAGHVTVISVPQLVFPGRPRVYSHQPLLTPPGMAIPKE
jgi:hypothetical protein